MIIYKIIWYIARKLKKDKQEQDDLTSGLTLGLLVASAFGLTSGLTFGLLVASAFGLTFGLTFGLIFGLTSGLIFGLAFGLGNYLIELSKLSSAFSDAIIIGVLILALAEVLFWSEKKKPLGKESKFYFTIKRKLWAIAESSYIFGNVIGALQIIKKGVPMLSEWLGKYGLSIMNFIGWGTAIVFIIFIYIKLNSLKYRKVK